MAGNGSELTPKQLRAVQALLTAKSIDDAATTAGVGARTLYRWLTEQPFKAALATAEGELLDAATRRLLGLQDAAIETFDDILKSASASQALRLRAAQSVLDYLLKLREQRDVEHRLQALEAALGDGKNDFS